MASEPYSADALSELRRILLTPEVLAEALGPLLTKLVQENNAQLVREMREELVSTLRTAVHEAVQGELGELSPEVTAKLVSALEPSVRELAHQQFTLLWPKAQATTDQYAVIEATQQAESPSPPQANSETAAPPGRKIPAPKGCRRLLIFGLALLITAFSTLWCWNKAIGLEVLFSEHEARHSVAGSIGGNDQQGPILIPTDPFQISPEATAPSEGAASSEGAAMLREHGGTSIPAIFSASTTTLDPTASLHVPIESDQPSPASSLEQTRELDLISTPNPPVTHNLPSVEEELTVSPTEEIAIEEIPANGAPVSTETTEPVGKALYLTFDDGPSNVWTPQILTILEQYDAHATFFVVGQEAAKRPELIQAIVNAGHVVAHHTWDHRTLEGVDYPTFVEEIAKTSCVLEGAVSPYLRLPGGATDANIRAYADKLGLEIVQWDIDPSDWKQPPAEEISALVIRHAAPNKIILLHDGGGNRSQTVAALPTILKTLQEQGYVFDPICRK